MLFFLIPRNYFYNTVNAAVRQQWPPNSSSLLSSKGTEIYNSQLRPFY